MQKITPHLWFDREAAAAAAFYTALFRNSRTKGSLKIHGTPSGTSEAVTIELSGQEFVLLSAGPYFKFTPAVSFLVACETKEEVDRLWASLSQGGSVLMELGEYPFSDRYGWVEDKYGVSWQVMSFGASPITQVITPTVMFVGDVAGKAEEAVRFYVSVFRDARVGDVVRYAEAEGPDTPGTIKHASFTLEGQEFAAMDSALAHDFTFTEATSFMVNCETQEEIDYYWERLSAVPEAEQCGWLKDLYGLSWQIVPTVLNEMLADTDQARVARVTEAFLKMKKLDIAGLKKAYADG